MWEAIKGLGDGLVWFAGIVTALSVLAGFIYKAVAKPLKAMAEENKSILAQNKGIKESMDTLTDDVGDILCDRLNQAHDYHMKKEWCPKADKTRLLDMHARYTKLGRNHLVENYANNLLRLPEQPPARTGRGALDGGN